MYNPILEKLTKECHWCKSPREEAASLWNFLAGRKHLFLTVKQCDIEGNPFSEEIRACQPVIHCTACNDAGRVFTDEGLELVKWLELSGFMTAELMKQAITNRSIADQAPPEPEPEITF